MNPIFTLLAGLAALFGPPEVEPLPAAPVVPTVEAMGDDRAVRSKVLPCGLRVIAARDDSLPVAALVLAIDIGTLDDPEDKTGLVHVLAYHLHQGNRELSPGQAVGEAHDAGGLSEMAVGYGSIRYSSLVPVSQLDRMLWVESHRLRLPTVNPTLWLQSISNARNDQRPRLLIEQAAVAAAWADPRLAVNRRKADKELGKLGEQELIAALDSLTSYPRATLAIVGPEAPDKLLERTERAFARVPEAKRADERHPPAALAPGTPGSDPRAVEVLRARGDAFVWPVEPSLRARVMAQSLCGTLNRQRRSKDEAPKTKVRCTFQDDTRFPTLSVKIAGSQAPARDAVAARIERVTDGTEDRELVQQLEVAASNARAELRRPLELAEHLAVVGAKAPSRATVETMLDAGEIGLDEAKAEIRSRFGMESAAALVPAPKAKPGDTGESSGADEASGPTRGDVGGDAKPEGTAP